MKRWLAVLVIAAFTPAGGGPMTIVLVIAIMAIALYEENS